MNAENGLQRARFQRVCAETLGQSAGEPADLIAAIAAASPEQLDQLHSRLIQEGAEEFLQASAVEHAASIDHLVPIDDEPLFFDESRAEEGTAYLVSMLAESGSPREQPREASTDQSADLRTLLGRVSSSALIESMNLTAREAQIVRLLQQGKSPRQVASELREPLMSAKSSIEILAARAADYLAARSTTAVAAR